MKSKKYIVAWDGAIDNVLNISKQLSGTDIDHVFYNVSSIENQNDNWVKAEDVRYYGHFFNAVKDFINNTNYEIFIFNAGDVYSNRHAEYVKYIEQIFSENPELAAFAPETDHDTFNGVYSHIVNSSKYENLFIATNTNGMYVALSRQMVVYMYMFYLWSKDNKDIVDFSKMVSGWGLDMCYCALAMILNKVIYRDATAKMHHPTTQSYTQNQGGQEYLNTINAFKIFGERVINLSSLEVAKRVALTIEQVRNPIHAKNTLEMLYSDPSIPRRM